MPADGSSSPNFTECCGVSSVSGSIPYSAMILAFALGIQRALRK